MVTYHLPMWLKGAIRDKAPNRCHVRRFVQAHSFRVVELNFVGRLQRLQFDSCAKNLFHSVFPCIYSGVPKLCFHRQWHSELLHGREGLWGFIRKEDLQTLFQTFNPPSPSPSPSLFKTLPPFKHPLSTSFPLSKPPPLTPSSPPPPPSLPLSPLTRSLQTLSLSLSIARSPPPWCLRGVCGGGLQGVSGNKKKKREKKKEGLKPTPNGFNQPPFG